MEEFRKEPATIILIAINVLVFLGVELTGMSQDVSHMLDWGAAYTPLIIKNGEVYRLFTCMFLHFGIEHLLNNMLVLFVLGNRLERVTGSVRFIVIYLLGGLTGNLLSLAMDMKYRAFAVAAGASGAVFAVMGAMLLVVIRNKGKIEDLSLKQILIMAAFSLYFGFASSGVDNAAHLGGLAAGFVLAFILYHPRKKISNRVPSPDTL